jgi:hypothetical protein
MDFLTDIITQLQTVTDLKWIDYDMQQLNMEHPPVSYPCALVEWSIPETKPVKAPATIQARADITIRLAFSVYSSTHPKAPTTVQTEAKAHFQIIKDVITALHLHHTQNFQPIRFTGLQPEPNELGLKVYALRFSMNVIL